MPFTTNLNIVPVGVFSSITQFLPADTTTAKSILVAPTNAWQVRGILVTMTDTIRDFVLSWRVSSTTYIALTVSIPANAGNLNTVPAVDILQALMTTNYALPINFDSCGNRFIRLDSTMALYGNVGTTLNTNKAVNVVCWGDTF